VVYDALLRKPYRPPFPLLQYFLPHIREQDLELVEVVHPGQFSVVVRRHPPVLPPPIFLYSMAFCEITDEAFMMVASLDTVDQKKRVSKKTQINKTKLGLKNKIQ
jgi:hypothetical protein